MEPGQAMTAGLRRLRTGLLIAGVAALGICVLAGMTASFAQGLMRLQFDRLLERSGAGSGRDTRSAASGLVGRLEIPRLGLSTMVREGSDAATLLVAAGHLPGSAFPGEAGNVVLSAHRDTFFRDLRRIRHGDEIRVATEEGEFRYRVETIRVVRPDRTELLGPTPERSLTLVTCYPFDFVGPAPSRFVVRAKQIEAGPESAPRS